MRTVAIVLALGACDEKAGGGVGTGDAPETDTDTDADADADADADTDADGDTGSPDTDTDVPDTGSPVTTPPTTPPTGRIPGCPPVWVQTPADLADCTYVRELYDSGNLVITTTGAYDASGFAIAQDVDNGFTGVRELVTWTRDPVTHDVATAARDLGADGSVETTEVWTWTYDVNGDVVAREIASTDVASGAVTTWSTAQTQGVCGVNLLAHDYETDGVVDYTVSTTRFLDGDERAVDEDGDGVPDLLVEYFVDPVTGQPLVYREEDDPSHAGWEKQEFYRTFDPVNGWILSLDGTWWLGPYGAPVDGNLLKEQAFDTDGRLTRFYIEITLFGVVFAEQEELTTWTCPP